MLLLANIIYFKSRFKMSELIKFEVNKNSVAILTLNDHDRLNALSLKMISEIHDKIKDINSGDTKARCLVITGSGKGFCSGANLFDNKIGSDFSKLDAYSTLDFNLNYNFKNPLFFNEIVLTAVVNNVLGIKYVSNGYYYTYDDNWSNPNSITTIEGAGYYPQATTNYLIGLKFKL